MRTNHSIEQMNGSMSGLKFMNERKDTVNDVEGASLAEVLMFIT